MVHSPIPRQIKLDTPLTHVHMLHRARLRVFRGSGFRHCVTENYLTLTSWYFYDALPCGWRPGLEAALNKSVHPMINQT